MRRLRLLLLPALALALATSALALAACGGSASSGSAGSSSGGGQATTATKAKIPQHPAARPFNKKPTVSVPDGPPPDHLVVRDRVKGTGLVARLGDEITVQYVGMNYRTGKEFDSSYAHGGPATFALIPGQLIEGWTKGIPGMRVGGQRELIVPPQLAYGAQGSPPAIPPNATLIFVIDLVKVQKGQ